MISSTGYKVEVEMQKNVSRFCVLGSMLEPDLEAWQIKPYLSKSCSSLARSSHRLGHPDMADIRGGRAHRTLVIRWETMWPEVLLSNTKIENLKLC